MLLALTLALQAGAQFPPMPQRHVPDSGVIASGARVTPAGVQSVFEGQVGGVRFGRNPAELWVAVPNHAYHLAWRENRVLSQAAFVGRPGVQGVSLDPASGRVLVTAVSKLPSDVAQSRLPGGRPLNRSKSVALLFAYSGDETVRITAGRDTTPALRGGVPPDSASVVAQSPALGDFMAGAPAAAAQAVGASKRLAVVPLPANDALAVLDAADATLLRTIPLGVLPVSAVIADNGTVAWVSNFGGPKPRNGSRAAAECCDPRAESVRVDNRGVALSGSVTRVDLVEGRVTDVISVGLHPTSLVWDQRRQLLFVANGNSDDVSVVDTRRKMVASTLTLAPFRQNKIGLAPTAVALAPDHNTLFVALGGVNAVAVLDVSAVAGAAGVAPLRGLIPTGWYPSSLDISSDGVTLAVGTLFGVGSGNGTLSGLSSGYVHAVRGAVNLISVPGAEQLAAYTTSVAHNNRLTLATSRDAPDIAPRRGVAARAVPERPGEPSLIDHVVYIIKENRTFDQVLGDIGKGARDPSLVMYGRDVTPNAHAIAEQFVLLDHFFASGGNSADGHQWLTQANETEYPMWPLYFGRSYPSEGNDPLTYSSGGFLWEAAQSRGKRVVVFGEYAPAASDSIPTVRSRLLSQYRDSLPHNPAFFRSLLTKRYNTRSAIPSLDKILVREYPGWTQETPDVIKADVFLEHLREWETRGDMPNLAMVILPSDHTVGTTPGWCTPRACVADNDLALGRIVEGLTHSAFWKSMAVLVVEDDAQDGVDHIDGHRTVALVASPFARRGVIDSTFYSQPSMVKTVELMLGLPALSMFDLVATGMHASFLAPHEKPDFTMFTALAPQQSLYETNQRLGAIRGPFAAERRKAALASSRMRFDEPDAAPSDALNRILWHDARGWSVRYPGVRQALFFPLAVAIDDDERPNRRKR